MEKLRINEIPTGNFSTMILAFSGWPDAIESATLAVSHLVETLPAKKFADMNPEAFYDFTKVRPLTLTNKSGERYIKWPTNEFYYFLPLEGDEGIILFKGTEPNLMWKTYSQEIMNIIESCEINTVIHLGALLDEIPHTRDPIVTGRASTNELTNRMTWLGIPNSEYKGPTGIQSAIMETCQNNNIDFISIWGHSPHYITTGINPKVTCALLDKLKTFIDIDIPHGELGKLVETYQDRITKAMLKQPDMMAYVRQLEKRYDDSRPKDGNIPTPDEMVEEIQEYFSSQQ